MALCRKMNSLRGHRTILSHSDMSHSPPPLGCAYVLSPVTIPPSHNRQTTSLTLLGYVQKQMPADVSGSAVTRAHACVCYSQSGGVCSDQLSARRWWMHGGNILGVWAMSFALKSFGTLLWPRNKVVALKIMEHMCLYTHTFRDKGVTCQCSRCLHLSVRIWKQHKCTHIYVQNGCLHQSRISLLLLRLD